MCNFCDVLWHLGRLVALIMRQSLWSQVSGRVLQLRRIYSQPVIWACTWLVLYNLGVHWFFQTRLPRPVDCRGMPLICHPLRSTYFTRPVQNWAAHIFAVAAVFGTCLQALPALKPCRKQSVADDLLHQ